MTGRGRGWRLSVVLWLAFAAVSVAGAVMLLAQSRVEGIVLLTADAQVLQPPSPVQKV